LQFDQGRIADGFDYVAVEVHVLGILCRVVFSGSTLMGMPTK
jgi:hypothetical protein